MAPKAEFTILEISERLNVPKHTLRFWEKKLEGVLAPVRTHGGQRRYTGEDLAVLEGIKKRRESGLSLREIAEAMKPSGEKENSQPDAIDALASRVAQAVKAELLTFFQNQNTQDRKATL